MITPLVDGGGVLVCELVGKTDLLWRASNHSVWLSESAGYLGCTLVCDSYTGEWAGDGQEAMIV